ncbi:PTS sugar transporter subunit IIA [Liquorilactobacillus vini]|uniref:PTS sugar transporter subunit IIA n=1 Tax=Liquorilactobacillus vini TaxID=238015 RepID=UPI0002F054F5|nr:PTS sugar transporter subunit IIA [Liquorilactobacillus vini]
MNDISKEVVFDATFVQHFLKAITFEDAIDSLSKNFLKRDLVTKDYADAVKKRENKFPTGLPTMPIGVAIPHTDAKYVKKNSDSSRNFKSSTLYD